MAKLKTTQSNASVTAFLNAIEDKQQRSDARKLASIMRAVTGARAQMWGKSMVGFGSYHYVYASGREGDWPIVGFSPRKQNLSVYIMPGFSEFGSILEKLGTYKTGKSCLYIKKLEDVDQKQLETLIARSVKHMRANYETT